MKILLLGEASYVHNILKKGLQERGHRVILASDGNNWHNSPRDIDLQRQMKYGKMGGLIILFKLLFNLPKLCGNDVVQVHNYQFVPLKPIWNKWIFHFLRLTNKRVVRGCWGDDPQILKMQAQGIPAYSDTYWNGTLQNVEDNRQRVAEQNLPEIVDCCNEVNSHSDALVACLFEYYLCYDIPCFKKKLHYIALPMELPTLDFHPKGTEMVIRVLVGLQPKREYIKGALKIAKFVESLVKKYPDRLKITYVEGIPYQEYCKMIDQSDVIVDQFYSYTPSMNSLAAMARGTVVIGGGEEEFYQFIGEHELRPIINVSPEYSEERNISIIEEALFTEGNLTSLSCQSMEFVKKYHDYKKVAAEYEQLYLSL